MELKWLEDFVALAELGSFSKAARERNVTQPAFGRRIRALEHWLGVALVDRESYPPELTPAGRLFRESAAGLVREVHRIRGELSQHGGGSDDTVTFTVPHVLATSFMPAWLREVKAEVGDFKARLFSDNVHDCIQRLMAGECDFYMGYFHPRIPLVLEPSRFAFLPLGTERLIPYAASDDAGAPLFALPGRPEAPVPYLGYGPGTFLDRAIELHLGSLPVTPFLRVAFENSIADTLKAMAADGQGVAWLPESLLRAEDLECRLAPAGDESWQLLLGRRLYRALGRKGRLAEKIWQSQSRGSPIA